MNSGDSFDEEYLDDPISLVDETDHQNYSRGGYKSSSRTSFVPVTFFDITNNVRLLNDCRPLYIKVVDCNKHPWYYSKFYKKHDTLKRNDYRDRHTRNSYDVGDCLSTYVPTDDSESETTDRDIQNVPNIWLMPKNRKIRYSLKRITSTKSILTINRKKSSKKRKKKKPDVDFKMNQGLIDFKNTKTTNIIDIENEPRIDTNKKDTLNNGHESLTNSKQQYTYFSDADKILKQVNSMMYQIAKGCDDNNIFYKTQNPSVSANKQDREIYSITQSQRNIQSNDIKTIDKAQNLSLSTNKKSINNEYSVAQSKATLLCEDSKTNDLTKSLPLSTNNNNSTMYPIAQSHGTIHCKHNDTIDKTTSLSFSINKKSLSPIFPCPSSNKNIRSQVNHISSGLSMSTMSTSNSSPSISEIIEHSRVNEAAKKISTQDMINTHTSAQESTKLVRENSQNNEYIGLPNLVTQITGAHPSAPLHENFSQILTMPMNITHGNKPCVVSKESQHFTSNVKSNAKEYQNVTLYDHSANKLLQYNLTGERNIYPTIPSTHPTSFEGNCSQAYKKSMMSTPFSEQKHSEANLEYLNYMNFVVGMPASGKTTSIPEAPYPDVMQLHYNSPPPALQMTDYYRMEPCYNNPVQYTNFNYQDYSQPHFYYQPILASQPLLESPFPGPTYVLPAAQLQDQNFHHTISPQLLGTELTKTVLKKPKNIGKFESNTVDSRKLQDATDMPKILNFSTVNGHTSKVVKDVSEEINLKKNSTALSQTVTVVESKVEMLQELEKEMMNIHGEIYNADDNIYIIPPINHKELEESRNKSKYTNTAVTQNHRQLQESTHKSNYNNAAVTQNLCVRKNNIFDIPFTLQERVFKYRQTPNTDNTINHNSKLIDGSVARNLKWVSVHNLGSKNSSPISQKSRVLHNSMTARNNKPKKTQKISNIPKAPKYYSPPILPIPSYDKTLEILTRATFEAKKYCDNQRKNELENNYVGRLNSKTAEHFESYYDKQEKDKKKVSLEEYKNRKTYEPVIKNVKQKCTTDSNVSNWRNKYRGDICRDLDQGYGSDYCYNLIH